MDKISVLINPSKDKGGEILRVVLGKLEDAFSDCEISVVYNCEDIAESIEKDIDLLIVLGGDGTLIGASRRLNGYINCPIFGINIGNLGFLTSADIEDLDKVILDLKKGDYFIQERMMLEGTVINEGVKKKNVALNDFVIARGTLSRMSKFTIYVDDKEFTSIKGDGIIISSPTGSSAYSFSAGGPLIYPTLDVILLTPICPHTKNMQTMVLEGKSNIKIISESYEEEVYLSIDGQKAVKLDKKDVVEISKAQNSCKILLLNDYDYFKVIRTKLFNSNIDCEGDYNEI
ncbi:putative inorganic polyphosphate/ATP-NAD kinase [compost metagenome]